MMGESGESVLEKNIGPHRESEPSNDCDSESKERKERYTRSDSGRGPSLTSSADLSDEDNVQNGQSPGTYQLDSSNQSNNSPFIEKGQLQNLTTVIESTLKGNDSESSQLTREDAISDYSQNNCIYSSSVLRPTRTLHRQNYLDISQDRDLSHLLENNPPLNPRSIENDKLKTPIECSVNVCGSPAMSTETNEESYGRNININNNMVGFAVQGSNGKNGLILPIDSWSGASSPHAIQNGFQEICDELPVITSGNFQHVGHQKYFPVLATSSSAYGLPRFATFPISPQGLVPKEIMDHLGKELVRERWKVSTLHQENEQLRMRVAQCEERHILDNEVIDGARQHLVRMHENIPLLKRQTTLWKQRFEDKEDELKKKEQEIKSLCEQNKTLEHENQMLKSRVIQEQNNTSKVKETLENLRSVLHEERARFNRDETSLKQRIQDLKHENKYLREDPRLCDDYSEPVLRERVHENCLRRRNQNVRKSDHSPDHSAETSLKRVYPESPAQYQKQGARPKQGSQKSSDSEVRQIKATVNKQISSKSSSVRDNASFSEEKCSNCYKLSSEFKSLEEFQRHKDRCLP